MLSTPLFPTLHRPLAPTLRLALACLRLNHPLNRSLQADPFRMPSNGAPFSPATIEQECLQEDRQDRQGYSGVAYGSGALICRPIVLVAVLVLDFSRQLCRGRERAPFAPLAKDEDDSRDKETLRNEEQRTTNKEGRLRIAGLQRSPIPHRVSHRRSHLRLRRQSHRRYRRTATPARKEGKPRSVMAFVIVPNGSRFPRAIS